MQALQIGYLNQSMVQNFDEFWAYQNILYPQKTNKILTKKAPIPDHNISIVQRKLNYNV